jgi:uncharacterized protein YecE (DUF72 family)
MTDIRIGTSAFTAEGWVGSFYPDGMQPRDFLSYYATKFQTVELDNTFYRTPSVSVVEGWNTKTPPGFIFAAKVPQICCGVSYVAQSVADSLSPAHDVI